MFNRLNRALARIERPLYLAVAFIVSRLARLAVPLFRYVGFGGRFEQLMMKVFRYRDITKLVDVAGVFHVGPNGGPEPARVKSLYLRRFYLTPRFLPVRIFLHHIARSDDDRDRHDHP